MYLLHELILHDKLRAHHHHALIFSRQVQE